MQEQEEYKSTNDICYLENICRSTHRYLLNVPRNRQMKAGIILKILESFIRLVLIGLSG